jgi:hypothetical protein
LFQVQTFGGVYEEDVSLMFDLLEIFACDA